MLDTYSTELSEKTDRSGTVKRPLLPLGTVISDRFEVVEFLGWGAMGCVVRALDRKLDGTEVALKILHPELVGDSWYVSHFKNEILVMRELSHPNIVRTFEFGEDGDSLSYIVMEYVDGASLGTLLNRAGDNGLPLEESLRILRAVARGMDYAHGQGVIHRDLKPDNILVNDEGMAKIVDFGLARSYVSEHRLSQGNHTVGTLEYMAPEQLRGERLDQRCDVYAFGILAYEILTGTVPFASDDYEEIKEQHCGERPPRISELRQDVPKWYQDMVDRCTAKRRSKRYQSFADIIQELEQGTDERGRKGGVSGFSPRTLIALVLMILMPIIISGSVDRVTEPVQVLVSDPSGSAVGSLDKNPPAVPNAVELGTLSAAQEHTLTGNKDAHWFAFVTSHQGLINVAAIPQTGEAELSVSLFDQDLTLVNSNDRIAFDALRLDYPTKGGARYYLRLNGGQPGTKLRLANHIRLNDNIIIVRAARSRVDLAFLPKSTSNDMRVKIDGFLFQGEYPIFIFEDHIELPDGVGQKTVVETYRYDDRRIDRLWLFETTEKRFDANGYPLVEEMKRFYFSGKLQKTREFFFYPKSSEIRVWDVQTYKKQSEEKDYRLVKTYATDGKIRSVYREYPYHYNGEPMRTTLIEFAKYEDQTPAHQIAKRHVTWHTPEAIKYKTETNFLSKGENLSKRVVSNYHPGERNIKETITEEFDPSSGALINRTVKEFDNNGVPSSK